jgi:hypothetical protein
MPRLATSFITVACLSFSAAAQAHCTGTDDVLRETAKLDLMVANLKNNVEHIAYATPAAEDLARLRPKIETFYDDVYYARRSCGALKRQFDDIETLGEETAAQVSAQGLNADQDINNDLVGMRFGIYNVGILVDRLH